MRRTLILGGGFGGIATAVALRRFLPDDEVVLVDRRSSFTMGLRKNWAIAGSEPLSVGTRSLSRLVRHGIDVRRGTIDGIEPDALRARVDDQWIDADTVVIALGAERDPGRVPGFTEHVLDAYDEAASAKIAAAVAGVRGGRVGIGIFAAPYPCPPAPFELALVLHDRFEALGVAATLEVFSALPASVPVLGQAGCEAFDAQLEAAGIGFLPGRQARIVTPDGVEFGDERRAYDLLIGVPPHRAPAVVASSSLAGPSGWVPVDAASLETRYPGVYAIGDVTTIPLANGMALPKAGLFAHIEGEVVAARIADSRAGRDPSATFAGDGACFIETGGGKAAMVRGGFLADPPAVEMTRPNEQTLAAKHAFETDRLVAWFGG